MKLIIAGSRDISDYQALIDAIEKSGIDVEQVTEIVSGCAIGVDSMGIRYAMETKKPIVRFPVSYVEWRRYGKSAGPRRNRKMAAYGDVLLAIWDGKSSGTDNMIKEMAKVSKPTYIHYTDGRTTLDDL
jgi:predicted Rossmann fold nucleotide-binding protein DprA/Smf involved in DNA uptake